MGQSCPSLLPLPLKECLWLFLKEAWAFRMTLPTDICAQLGYCSMVFIPGPAFVEYEASRPCVSWSLAFFLSFFFSLIPVSKAI